jgi:outer membrane protein OmpA-like peptidoglycan-associated protein
MLATLALGAGALGSGAEAKSLESSDGASGKTRAKPRAAVPLEADLDLTQIQGSAGVDALAGQDGGDGQDGADTLRLPVATAYAPGLIASSDTCMGARVIAGQSAGLGITVARTWQDDNCRRLKNARQLNALGYRRAAVALLCIDDEVREAMRVAGTPCPGEELVSFAPEPQPEPEPAPPPHWPRYAVLFDFDSATLKAESDEMLQQMLAVLQADPGANVDIVGHTDWVGTDAYNLGLSQRRAQAVVDWLIAHGIARERLNAVGRGEAEPIAENTTPAGRQQNRRVEIRRR